MLLLLVVVVVVMVEIQQAREIYRGVLTRNVLVKDGWGRSDRETYWERIGNCDREIFGEGSGCCGRGTSSWGGNKTLTRGTPGK